jgi:Glycosyltransferase sugar-binding region containing DXD motif
MAGVIQSLWIGDQLSVMEQLCISSFLRNGHTFHLYVYQETAGVPPGTVVLDGNDVLPASRIFTYNEHNTYAGFANFFRYKLLFEKGGWFVDADTICLRPFQFRSKFVFSSEGTNGRQLVNVGAIKVPASSPIMRHAWEACECLNTSELKWSQCGPALLGAAVEAYSLARYVKRWDVFCPVHFSVWEKVLDPNVSWTFDYQSHAIHLWNELWRRSGQDKNARYPPDCLYEQLKRRYLE